MKKKVTFNYGGAQCPIVEPLPPSNVDQYMLQIIDRVIQLQERIICAGTQINHSTRLQLLFVFLRVGFAVTFNAYNLALFGANLANSERQPHLSIPKSLIFYSYHIISHAVELLITIVAFSCTYDSILQTAHVVNKLNIYCMDVQLRHRLSQFVLHVQTNLKPYTIFGLYPLNASLIYSIVSGITTYIIILLQYGLEKELDASYPLGAKTNDTSDSFKSLRLKLPTEQTVN